MELLQKEGAGNAAAVKIASMRRAKGTEFSRVVVVIGAEAGVLPDAAKGCGWSAPRARSSPLIRPPGRGVG
ncbi:MAG: hypothetical protein ACRDUV_25945 [Pseudonocardiaceae bacterium]